MRAVASSAGCTKPALYYHFGAKDALFTECIRVEAEGWSRLVHEGLASSAGSVAERLAVAIGAFFEHITEDPSGLRLVYRAALSRDAGQPALDADQVRCAPVELTTELLAEGVERGEVRHDVNLSDGVLALLGMVDQRCRSLVFEGVPIPPECPQRLVDLFFNGVSS
jgi:AcrR family transcriptional regulator